MSLSVQNAAVIGTGLIGTSIALALKKSGFCGRIYGFSRSSQSIERAVEMGAVDERLPDFQSAGKSDIVILSSPVGKIIRHLHKLGKSEFSSRLIIDAGSVKLPVEKAAVKVELGRIFVGGHPMAGGEKSGPGFADPNLFRGKIYFLVPTSESSEEALSLANEFVGALGARAMTISAVEHDRIVALTSHLPYLLAASLSETAADAYMENAHVETAIAGGFSDLTRIAGGAAEMWTDIISLNRENLGEWLYVLLENLRKIVDVAGNPEELKNLLAHISEKRSKLLH